MTRTDTPQSWDERATLATFLDYVRAAAVDKCAGVSEEHARTAYVPSSPLTTMSALISHLRWVEYSWFETVFLGEKNEGPWKDDPDDPDREMAADTPLATLIADYEEQSARYRDLVAKTDLDATAVRAIRDGRHVTLRWILMHLVEETARHNGHLDLLREMADGTKGT
ncbi:MAG: DUF664 domain-containing protein [Streptosporangiales bacterium]|nr:DUF664 domain-containing protein [Streptosporangiales bacterium]